LSQPPQSCLHHQHLCSQNPPQVSWGPLSFPW
jgi:hypothetical protein